MKRYALISVSDKTGVVELARAIVAAGYEILSTGGTAKVLRANELEVCDVADYTGFPEMLDGRVKTLHPKVYGGLLARRDDESHYAAMVEHGIDSIDLVVVNLYPFVDTVAREGVGRDEAIEQIDIGGPSMLRAAAKNHDFVCVVADPRDYPEVIRALKGRAMPQELRARLAARAFSVTAEYDSAISCYLAGEASLPPVAARPAAAVATPPAAQPIAPAPEPAAAATPATVTEPKATEPQSAEPDAAEPDAAEPYAAELVLTARKVRDLRYGENPHQTAAFYALASAAPPMLAAAEVLGGKELSYNNILDLDAALALVREFTAESAACAIIKHGNPCGTALGVNLAAAFVAALECDPVSAFGSILASNVEVDRLAAQQIAKPGNFVEAIIAPAFTDEALDILRGAKFGANLRLVATGPLETHLPITCVRSVSGGLLVQSEDPPRGGGEPLSLDFRTKRRPGHDELKDLRFAWSVAKHVRSNAIVLARQARTVGVGAGQMSRVDSVGLAVEKAGDRARGAVLASDAFFPFADGVLRAAEAGVTAVIQPGGSRRDAEVIAAADDHGIAMVFTGVRHFRH